ncbi:MAG: aminotransferase class III-fold pyridoxal phosphate-dependent enzyme [Lachnospiraceae bacterium]|nr:aminotransferase class III-fold pyridoxal phosphate-dependent enzyme [Lachnospiraceae bacterium]
MGESQELYEKAKKIIPGGTQLLSKRPEMHLPGLWPAYYKSAKGCRVTDLDDNIYYDMSFMGIGANVLGYCDEDVDNAVIDAVNHGSMCTLNAPEEVELAELLLELHPWADMVRYAKTGGEALSIAVRIARACTGKEIVLICGYHGWHDWYLAANLEKGDPLSYVHLSGLEPKGVPSGLADTNFIFSYNDIERFQELINKYDGKIAAVIMESIRNDYPENDFLQKIRKITKEKEIILIFDEVSAGFRLCCGGAHLVLDVTPDMITMGKALSNGYPMAAILGKGNVMKAAQDTFISSTYWTERIGLAASIATINKYRENQVDKHLDHIGTIVKGGLRKIADKHNISINISGINPMTHFEFQYDKPLVYKTFFTQEMLKRGYLATTAIYASYAHTDETVKGYINATDEVFGLIQNYILNGELPLLDGTVCHSGFQRLA